VCVCWYVCDLHTVQRLRHHTMKGTWTRFTRSKPIRSVCVWRGRSYRTHGADVGPTLHTDGFEVHLSDREDFNRI